MPRTEIRVVMDMSLDEAMLLRADLGTRPCGYPTDTLWEALNAQLERFDTLPEEEASL